MFPPQLSWMGRDWSIWKGWLALTNGGWRVLVSCISNTNWIWHNSRPISIVYSHSHSIKKRLPLSPGCHSVSFCGSSPGWRFVICPLMLWVMMTWATGTPSSSTVPGGEEVPQEAAEIIPVSYTPWPAILSVEVTVWQYWWSSLGVSTTFIGFTNDHMFWKTC